MLAVCHGTDAERTARVIVLGMVATDALAVVDNYVVVVGVRASGSTCTPSTDLVRELGFELLTVADSILAELLLASHS